ncbi:TetR/AcrR family transcriptional regulator [Chelativorans alearense]|uniref:TetR/AcrR family transcriptional regulator n=1 Tax=Chelativorans alearense TaxID=2681495 RepID=UPI001FE4A62C|nr:TetR/AcrR family transcriptional regulator [Chelativorans alearense]
METEPMIDGAAAKAGRSPSQKRSRERVERILAVAADLIEEAGSDAMKMSEVAARAGISIGSLYQYFPDKAAVIRTLAERYNEGNRHCIAEALEGVRTVDGLLGAFGRLIDTYYALFLAEPVMRDIWSGIQADKALSEMELREARAIGAMLAAAMLRARPDKRAKDVEVSAFLIMHLGEAAMRLAITLDREEGRAVVEAYKAMAMREIAAALG